MAKLSGLIGSGKIGVADETSIKAMPDAPRLQALESNAPPKKQALDSNAAISGTPEDQKAFSSALKNEALESNAVLPKNEALESNALPQITGAVEWAGSKFARLPTSVIVSSRFQVRTVADDEYIESLMLSIGESGVISPIVVRPLPKKEALESNAYEIVAGHHRFEACRRLLHPDVNVIIKDMTDAEAARALASDNLVRKDLDDYERFKHAKMLKDHGFCKTNSEIGVVLGISRTLVSFLMAFDAFPAGAKAVLETHPGILGATQANELKDIATEEPDVFTEALLLLADGKLQQNQIRTWVEKRFKGSPVRMQKRRVLEISRPGLVSPIKVTYNENEAKIQSPALNIEKLQKLIEENLDDLIG